MLNWGGAYKIKKKEIMKLNKIITPGHLTITTEVDGYCQLSGYQCLFFIFCPTEERNSYRFGSTYEWLNNGKIFQDFWVNYPFNFAHDFPLNQDRILILIGSSGFDGSRDEL